MLLMPLLFKATAILIQKLALHKYIWRWATRHNPRLIKPL